MIGPGAACAGVEEDRDEEEVDEALADLLVVWRVGCDLPLSDERIDTRAACVQVPPSAVGRDLGARS